MQQFFISSVHSPANRLTIQSIKFLLCADFWGVILLVHLIVNISILPYTVLGQVVDCMTELLAQGQPVKLDGLGTFSPSVDGQKKGKVELADAVAAGPDAMINGIKINFTPENIKGEKLTSGAFKEQCVFEFGYLVESEIRTISGKQKRVQKKTPLSYVLAPAADNNGGGGGNG